MEAKTFWRAPAPWYTETRMYTVRLTHKKTIAEGTKAFFFEKPDGFTYIPGQYIELALIGPEEIDGKGGKCFSLISIPSDRELGIATRMRDTAFKRALDEVQEGETVHVDGPFGSLVLHKNIEKPAIFVAGGIGITPFYSIIRSAAERGFAHTITLFYSNRRPEDAPFLRELSAIARQYPHFTFVPTMTQTDRSKEVWNGEKGHIDAAMMKRYCGDLSSSTGYVAGPPRMAVAMRKALVEAGADEDNVRMEEFPGY